MYTMAWSRKVRKGLAFKIGTAILVFIGLAIITSYRRSTLPQLPALRSYLAQRIGERPSFVKVDNSRFPNNVLGGIKCMGAAKGEAEDLFCSQKPSILKNYKNPCWKDGKETLRCLPYFHLGTTKCGSTDLLYRIQQHPEVTSATCPQGKECRYWAWKRYGYDTGLRTNMTKTTFSEYIKNFDRAAKRIEKETLDGYHHVITGDGSPMTFWDFRGWTKIPQNQGLSEPRVLTPHLMKHIYGDMKMILILRDPVDRLYSSYFFLRQGDSPESFHTDAVRSVEMMRNCLHNNSIAACFYNDHQYYLPSRIHVGCYSVFLKEWLSVFPRENFLFLRTEDYGAAPAKTLSSVFKFLKLKPLNSREIAAIVKRTRRNVTHSKKKAPPMFNSTRVLLSNFYAQYNKELAHILKDDRFLWGL